MNHHYADIRNLIPTPPLWWDENAVPRYCTFTPAETANIYAEQVVLLRVRCQSCGRPFDVCMSWSALDSVRNRVTPLDEQIREKSIHYGDPPNVECCLAGATMNSEPDRVLEFWRHVPGKWEHVRDAALEISVEEAPGS